MTEKTIWGISGLFSRRAEELRVPDGKRVYAVGDIHGRLDLLDRMLAAIKLDASRVVMRNVLIFLGDYVDRGPDSKGVIERLCSLNVPDWEIIFLLGNHDQAVLDFLSDAMLYRSWRNFGAAETLLSYGIYPPRFDNDDAYEGVRHRFSEVLPSAHRQFFENLKDHYAVGGYYFAHAGVRPGVPLDRQVPEDLLWIRDVFLQSDIPLKKVVVHGHTPQDAPSRDAFRIGVDTGAYSTGCLSAAVLEAADCKFLSVRDTDPLIGNM